jgi:colanic acid biosynthesis protein WcaH
MFLDDTTFKTVIASTPLISIDLVIKNTKGEYLLGYRNNRHRDFGLCLVDGF